MIIALLVLSLVFFALATFRVGSPHVRLGWAGVASLVIAQLVSMHGG